MTTTRTKPRPNFRLAVAERGERVPVRLGPKPLDVINAAVASLQRTHGPAFTVDHLKESRTPGLWLLYGTLEVTHGDTDVHLVRPGA